MNVPVDTGLCGWGPGRLGAMLAPGPVTSAPLVRGLVGGGQEQSKAQEAAQEEAQHQDEAQQEDDPWKGQEQVLRAKKQHVRPRADTVGSAPASPGLIHETVRAASQLTPLRAHLPTQHKSEPYTALTNSPGRHPVYKSLARDERSVYAGGKGKRHSGDGAMPLTFL